MAGSCQFLQPMYNAYAVPSPACCCCLMCHLLYLPVVGLQHWLGCLLSLSLQRSPSTSVLLAVRATSPARERSWRCCSGILWSSPHTAAPHLYGTAFCLPTFLQATPYHLGPPPNSLPPPPHPIFSLFPRPPTLVTISTRTRTVLAQNLAHSGRQCLQRRVATRHWLPLATSLRSLLHPWFERGDEPRVTSFTCSPVYAFSP